MDIKYEKLVRLAKEYLKKASDISKMAIEEEMRLSDLVNKANEEYRMRIFSSNYLESRLFQNNIEVRNMQHQMLLLNNMILTSLSMSFSYLSELTRIYVNDNMFRELSDLSSMYDEGGKILSSHRFHYLSMSAIAVVISQTEARLLLLQDLDTMKLRRSVSNVRLILGRNSASRIPERI